MPIGYIGFTVTWEDSSNEPAEQHRLKQVVECGLFLQFSLTTLSVSIFLLSCLFIFFER